MALDKPALRNRIIQVMEAQLPDGESLSSESRDFAAGLANAIHTYVTGGDVTGVRVRLDDETLDQSGTGVLR